MKNTMNTVWLKSIAFALIIIHLVGCEKIEGEGGDSKIYGTLIQRNYNDNFSILITEKPDVAQDIYIKYGNSMAVGNRVRTSENGYFEFPFLYPGDYTIFYTSKDSTNGNSSSIEKVITINLKRGENRDLGKLFRLKTLDFDDGEATIKGQIKTVIYRKLSQWPHLIPHDTVYAVEKEVYLTYNHHSYYNSRIRTQFDGTFYFNNLLPGKYKVFFYSDRIDGGIGQATILKEIEIKNSKDTINLGLTLIHKL
jgi:hypothetical protein